MKRFEELVEKQFLTWDEVEEIEEMEEVTYEDCGMSGLHYGYHYYTVEKDGEEYSIYIR